ncbi:AT hook motif DNA-binding family protein [Rhynchospora pubera]|uniref:AT-hook motif nuclear-localized protein n=1 Tax=Rhynchospora pubera TaxID=906938 RepID=A0AAV8DWX1_9POAL|nr:AT hook motif DNA-binding family protein [Rhynchospora pubera]KAJ4802530.1 AT hook motif DNA-binding family protein [Rhynchospora pubera]
MEGKEPYSSSGFSSYYIQNRPIHAQVSSEGPTHLTGLHSLHGSHVGFHPNPISPPGALSMQHSHIGSGFEMDPPSSHQTVPPSTLIQGEVPVKKKRGRPRKYGPDGKAPSDALQSQASRYGNESGSGGSALVSMPGDDSQKKRRGRPPGTGRKQQLASLGEWFSGSAGTGFTPHVIIIHPDEDVVSKIMAFSNQGPRAVSILSANGSVSTVTLCQSESSGVVTYEGLFEILSLSGSYLLTESNGARTRSGGLTITLSGPDGRVLGGILGGVLRASTSVQVVIGSFLYGISKSKSKNKNREESDLGEKDNAPSGTIPGQIQHQNLTAIPPSESWPGSRLLDMRTSNIDINLTRG